MPSPETRSPTIVAFGFDASACRTSTAVIPTDSGSGVAPGTGPAAEAADVVVAPDLQDVTADVAAAVAGGAGVPPQEVLDVVAVDRRTTVEAEAPADRSGSSQVPEPDLADRRRPARDPPRAAAAAGGRLVRRRRSAPALARVTHPSRKRPQIAELSW